MGWKGLKQGTHHCGARSRSQTLEGLHPPPRKHRHIGRKALFDRRAKKKRSPSHALSSQVARLHSVCGRQEGFMEQMDEYANTVEAQNAKLRQLVRDEMVVFSRRDLREI